jgi:hypothetical protein
MIDIFSGDTALIMCIIRSIDKILFSLDTFEVGFRDGGKYGLVV